MGALKKQWEERWQEVFCPLLEEAERKALDSLARYKFLMFGYHAAQWVMLAEIWRKETGERLPNPFRPLVNKAREVKRHGR